MTVVDLVDAGGSNAGGKAGALADLARAGFNVPPGFVVSASAYRDAARALGLAELSAEQAQEARSRLLTSELPSSLVEDISRALSRCTAGAPTEYVAVRSSSPAEDGAHASAAGQHDSFLAVRGIDEVCDAIRRCWASAWTERAAAYRARNTGQDAAADMAVLVQQFIDPNVSGVMFTNSTSVIEASWGVGERIVAGQITPDRWRVRDSGVIERRPGHKTTRTDRNGGSLAVSPIAPAEQGHLCLSDREIMHLHVLGKEVSTCLGGPRDIEWASTTDMTWVLQARPVTAVIPPATARPRLQHPPHPPQGSVIITGEPASPGVASGPVRTVRGPGDFPHVEPGDVLVCRNTDPAWTPLFTLASAVVTETGGVLSHAAIVAREVGIPAVLAVPGATDLLTASTSVTVNGDTGQISRTP